MEAYSQTPNELYVSIGSTGECLRYAAPALSKHSSAASNLITFPLNFRSAWGFIDDRSQFKVHTNERTQIHGVRSSLAGTLPSTSRVNISFDERVAERAVFATEHVIATSSPRHRQYHNHVLCLINRCSFSVEECSSSSFKTEFTDFGQCYTYNFNESDVIYSSFTGTCDVIYCGRQVLPSIQITRVTLATRAPLSKMTMQEISANKLAINLSRKNATYLWCWLTEVWMANIKYGRRSMNKINAIVRWLKQTNE